MKKSSLIIAISLSMLSLTACGGVGDGIPADRMYSSNSSEGYDIVDNGVGVAGYGDLELDGTSVTSEMKFADAAKSSETGGSGSRLENNSNNENNNSNSSQSTQRTSNQKLIRKVNLRTKIKSSAGLRDTINNILNLVDNAGGWVASNNVDFGSRYAGGSLSIRIPKNNVDNFLEVIENSDLIVTSKNETITDVTMDYVDTESRLNVKIKQKEKYMEYLDSAVSVDDLLNIEDKLADVVSDIEAFESKLKSMDSQIEYTEINLNIECETSVNRESFWERFKTALKDIREEVGETFLDGLAWFLNALVSLVFFIPIMIIVIKAIVLAFNGKWEFKKRGNDKEKKFLNNIKNKVSEIKEHKNKTKSSNIETTSEVEKKDN